jgi:hypothetical protein
VGAQASEEPHLDVAVLTVINMRHDGKTKPNG